MSIEGSVEIKDVVEETGVFFQLGFMRRFDSGYLAAGEADSGEIGNRVQFKSTSRDRERPDLDYLRPENSGGLFVDMGIHDFDLARWLMGEVKSVYATGGVLAYPEMSEIGDVDNAIVNLYFEDGTIGAIDLLGCHLWIRNLLRNSWEQWSPANRLPPGNPATSHESERDFP